MTRKFELPIIRGRPVDAEREREREKEKERERKRECARERVSESVKAERTSNKQSK